MTDRVRTIVVTLRRDTRVDDVECVCDAIRLLGPVAAVEVGPPVTFTDHMARDTARREWQLKLRDVLWGNAALDELAKESDR